MNLLSAFLSPRALRLLTISVLYLILLVFFAHFASSAQESPARIFNAQTATLKNGLQLVVVENHRAPIVTHMLWVRAGAADEPESVGGVAHFLEHLMFKGTPTQEPGSYSRRIRALGGNDNAFTSQDFTAYFFTIGPRALPMVMAMERERFLHLSPPAEHIKSEHNVILEERRQRTENDPLGAFYEQMNAYLFASTPYDNPVIGWMDDMKRLEWKDAKDFMERWYSPGNSILILSGDITFARAKELAQKYYGDWPARQVPERRRLSPPPYPAETSLSFASDKIEQPQATLAWHVPSYRQNPSVALALQVMAEALDGGASTPLYQNVVVRDKIATGINLSYDPDAWGGSSLWLAATPAEGISPDDLAAKIRASFIGAARALDTAAITQAIDRLQRQAIFARDPVSGPAMAIGSALATGSSLEQIETWPHQIGAVTAAQVQSVVQDYLDCPAPTESCGPPLVGIVHTKAGARADPSPKPPSLPQTGGHS